MRPAKAVLSPIAVTLSVLLAARLASGGMQVPHQGCDLPFQPGVTFTVTNGGGYSSIDMTKWNDAALIQSSTGCVDPLLDYPNAFNPSAPTCFVVPKSLGQVKIYSKRDDGGKFLYLLFDVDDQTVPTNQVQTGLGDRILIQLDTKPSGAKSLTSATFRLDYVVPRGSPGTGTTVWYQGSTTNQTAAWTQGNPPANLAIAGGDRPDASGYRVAFQIPTADATVGYNLAANNFPDFGIAIAIINDVGCVDPNADPQNPGATYEMLTGAAFPGGVADAQNPNSLTISNFTDPMLTELSFVIPDPNAGPEDNWFNPSLWATGTFKGAGDSVYISQSPNFWTSEDIKTTYCNVAQFGDVIGPGQPNSNWYQYFSGAPCALGTFAQFRVHTPGAQDIRRRVVFFWAESGMNIPIWNFVRLTAPITLSAGTLTAQTPACPWTNVPAGLTSHPCVRVLVLPESLTDAVWSESFIRGLTSIPDSGDPSGKDLAGLKAAYGIADSQTAQMNIEWSSVPVPCPPAASCLPCADTADQGAPGGNIRQPGGEPPPRGPVQPRFLQNDRTFLIRPTAFQQPGKVAVPAATPRAATPPTTSSLYTPRTAAVIDFQAVGIAPRRPGRRYTFLQTLGGVTKVVSLSYLYQTGAIPLNFNVTNSKDVPRSITVATQVTLPPDVPPIGVHITPFPYSFGKGETKAITVSVHPNAGPTSGPQPPPVGGGPCPCPNGRGPVYQQPIAPPNGRGVPLLRRSPRIIYSEPVVGGSY